MGRDFTGTQDCPMERSSLHTLFRKMLFEHLFQVWILSIFLEKNDLENSVLEDHEKGTLKTRFPIMHYYCVY